MLVQILHSLPHELRSRVEVWLPTDLPHPTHPLCEELASMNLSIHHVDIPILRRAYRTPMAVLRLCRRSAALQRRLRTTRAAMVYCTTSAALLAAPIARLARVPVVVAHAQEIWSGSDRRALTALAMSCDRLISISDAVADALPSALRHRTRVVANATPDPGTPSPIDARERPLRFVVASRWNRWKGHGTLLAAWDLAGCPGQLDVLGGPPLSGEVTDVPATVARLAVPETVRIVGEVADPAKFLCDADVAVIPSDEPEPFGLVAIEAFARGRPVVASAAGGLLDIVTDGYDGWTFEPGDVAALAAILRSLTGQAVVTAGDRARRTFEQRYTIERYRREWLDAVGLER